MSPQLSAELARLLDSTQTEPPSRALLSHGLWDHLSSEIKSSASDALARCKGVLGENVVLASGLEMPVSLSLTELWQIYLPLALLCREKNKSRRKLVGIAGPSGGGKTVFAEVLCKVINQTADEEVAITLGMDGYHYPNEYLDCHTAADGQSLRLHKGKPGSFDVVLFVSAINDLRTRDELSLPEYDRSLHEPVEGRKMIAAAHRLVLIEGNYLLHDEDGWERVRSLLHCIVYLDVDEGICRERLKARHMRGGRSEADTEAHIRRVDEPNHILVKRGMPLADLVLEQGVNAQWRVQGTLR